jgi:hypothetical protein
MRRNQVVSLLGAVTLALAGQVPANAADIIGGPGSYGGSTHSFFIMESADEHIAFIEIDGGPHIAADLNGSVLIPFAVVPGSVFVPDPDDATTQDDQLIFSRISFNSSRMNLFSDSGDFGPAEQDPPLVIRDENGVTMTYIIASPAEPVPEPSPLALFVSGVTLPTLAYLRRKHRRRSARRASLAR